MSLFSRFSSAKYDDVKIVTLATQAIEENPLILNPGQVAVSSKNGVVTLSGTVSTDIQMRHAEGAVNSALRSAALKHAEIVNQLVVSK